MKTFKKLTEKQLKKEVIKIFKSENKIAAIKFHRNQTACGLKQSIEYFESLNLENKENK